MRSNSMQLLKLRQSQISVLLDGRIISFLPHFAYVTDSRVQIDCAEGWRILDSPLLRAPALSSFSPVGFNLPMFVRQHEIVFCIDSLSYESVARRYMKGLFEAQGRIQLPIQIRKIDIQLGVVFGGRNFVNVELIRHDVNRIWSGGAGKNQEGSGPVATLGGEPGSCQFQLHELTYNLFGRS